MIQEYNTSGYEFVIFSKKHGPCFVYVDESDAPNVLKHKWNYQVTKRGQQVITCCKYAGRTTDANGKRVTVNESITLHRFIMGLKEGDRTNVDHVNGYIWDNRRYNLRLATSSQNSFNRPVQKNNTSGFKGVSYNKQTGKFTACIGATPKQARKRGERHKYFLGYFIDALSAAKAYNEAALKYHGTFARLNVIPD